uniref:Sorting nexin-4 n=1 Tax=Lygus hesperus TaxID=30085 RepID=A0A0A9X5Y0_LYGHE
MVERRYSEVVDLRELLVCQFPTLIIPPLPAKSAVRDVETFLNAGDAIAIQRFNLQFFLKEIAAMPVVMFFSEWTAPFFLDPRDSFETSTLLRIRAALKAFRTVN